MKAPEVYLASNLDGMISDNFAGYIWSIKMKARNYIGLMILTSLLLSGCQATPAQDIVANKNDHQTEQSKAESVVDSTEVADDEKIVSEGYSESFASDSGDVIINIQVGQVKVPYTSYAGGSAGYFGGRCEAMVQGLLWYRRCI